MKYVPPSVHATAFNCPFCDVLTTQTWYSLVAKKRTSPPGSSMKVPRFQNQRRNVQGGLIAEKELRHVFVSRCGECDDDISVWIGDKLVHPQRGNAPLANPDLPKDVRRDYDEASSILDLSPSGAAALLRLALERLLKELKLPGKDLNDTIGELVKKGVADHIQEALDSVRVMGNEAVHPGQIDLDDDRATAEMLFVLLNLIVDKIISEPKRIAEVYAKLPAGPIKGIKKRDGTLE